MVKHEETRMHCIARNNARCTQSRKTTHGLDGQHQTWTGLFVEESVRMEKVAYVHGVANPRIEDGERTKQNRA